MSSTPLSTQDRRLIADYLRALRNEVAVDERALALSRLPSTAQVRLPRPALWLPKGKRAPWLLPFVAVVSLLLWRWLGPAYFARQRRAHAGEGAALPPAAQGQIVALSSRCGDIVHAGHLQPLPARWLTVPWAPLGTLPPGAEESPLLSLLSDADMDHALRLSRHAHRWVHHRRRLRPWGLQTYTAWRWFAVRLAIDKLAGPLLMVNHFDRWAVLVDASAAASRRQGRPRPLLLMQHGSVGAEQGQTALLVDLPSRLRAVTRLHVYSQADATIFRNSVLSKGCSHRGVEVTCFRPRIELTRLGTTAQPRVLFVGHPLCEALHLQVLDALLRQRQVQAYYKPHPATQPGEAIVRQAWTVIKGRSEFPEVDLLVSYPSTLVTEYEPHGIGAVVHPIDRAADGIADLVAEIERHLDARGGAARPTSPPVPRGDVPHVATRQ